MITLEFIDSVALVRIDRPEKLNALTREMVGDLAMVFMKIKREQTVRAVILTATGDVAFCAGTDIAELSTLTAHEALSASRRGQETCASIQECGVPVIAAVNGIAAGGGCELALACHIRIASEEARFSLPEVRLGVIPAYGGTQQLTRATGSGRALEMMLTGAELSADGALRIGLVNRIVPRGSLDAEAATLAREIANLAPLAIRACLEAVIRGSEMSLNDGLELEARLFSSLFATEDVREGTRAFLEKRAPVFKGQ